MLRKLLLLLGFVMLFNIPLAAQHTHIELNYQSFRPFIHFQLNVETHRYHADSYESVYLKGYMDGVNDKFFYGPTLVDIIQNIRAYKAGYRDGIRDRSLLIRLRGHRWYQRHRFSYDDYYAPTYAIQIWLSGLSLAFLKAPEHRLPHRWHRRAHAHVKKYRKWMRRQSHRPDHDGFYSAPNVERRFKKRIRNYRNRLNDITKRRRGSISHTPKRIDKKRYERQRSRLKSTLKSRIKRSRDRGQARVEKRGERSRKKIKKRGSRTRNRGNVNRDRKRENNKSKKQRSRRGNRNGND